MRTLLSKNHWHRKELAIYGTTCDEVSILFERIILEAKQNLVFVDASHKDSGDTFDNLTSQEGGFSFFQKMELTSTTLGQYAGAVVNGNHHMAGAQIIVVNEKKKESLLKRKSQLTNVLAIISEEENALPEYLEEFKAKGATVMSESAFLSRFIPSYFSIPALNMLILAGGESKRMGEDKAMIKYNNEVQLDRIIRLAQQLEIKPYLSVRETQLHWGNAFEIEIISDVIKNAGPLGGIVSAMKFKPEDAWLVVACDLPLLNANHLALLVKNRNSKKCATCFKSPMDGGPEPLVTIYEPTSLMPLLAWWAQGNSCPRKMLYNSPVEIIEPNDNSVLTNVNTPEERKKIELKL